MVRIVRMVRMVRSLADRTFQLCAGPPLTADRRAVLGVAEQVEEVRVLLLQEGPPVLLDTWRRAGLACENGFCRNTNINA